MAKFEECDYEVFWNTAMQNIRSKVSEAEWNMYFGEVQYHSNEGNTMKISVPSLFCQAEIRKRYLNELQDIMLDLSGQKIDVELVVERKDDAKKNFYRKSPVNTTAQIEKGDQSRKATTDSYPEIERRRFPRGDIQNSVSSQDDAAWRETSRLNEDYRFDSYVIGENNSFAANAAIAISRNPGTSYNPCLVYGGVGLGKTHLIQAIGNAAHERDKTLKIVYATAETFTDEFIQAIKNQKNHNFKNKYRSIDILLIDDIHFLQGKDATQEELFHTFNALYDAKKQLIFTCDRPVSELKQLKDRLRNRFERGLNVDLQPPNYETRFAILKRKLEQNGSNLSDGILELICKNITTNVRDLEAALLRLIAYSELVSKDITLEIAQNQLRDVFSVQRQGAVSIEHIQRAVADYFNVSPSDLKGKKRSKGIILPRQISMYIARNITEYSTTEIGLEFGGRDHSTVMHSCQRIESRIKTDSTLEPAIRNLIRTIQEME